ncbi:hypothetical protein EV702DRAFT_519731 [Suillus placidus]|uniref:CFEM domain-containing protein n=1 Tax=Suillus placidus TaxID=48579 RepID=A0A9P6ZQ21_9AGAM|nr:hypothetical protein EV702DRAFT_519731 [Suillus placidus]
MHCSLVFAFLLAFGFCAAQNYTLPQCAQVCAGTAATAAGCYSYSNATCVCASQLFQAAIQSCFNTSCNTTTQGTAWQYYSNLCTDGSSASFGTSTFSGQSTTTTVNATTSTALGPVTSHTSSTQTTSLSSVGLASVSSTTTSASQTPTSTSGALVTGTKMLRGFMAVVVGGALIL